VIILEAKKVELKIQWLVDINRGEEDDHLFNERQSRETVRQLRKSRKLRQLAENEDSIRQLSYTVLIFSQLS
jgi:hypothetical protein